MKRIVLALIFALSSSWGYSQTGNFKDVRQTYLWDVTLSMQGKGSGCPDIWKEVKEALVRDIKQIDDEKTEIVVVPFQHKALEIWREYATHRGKETIIRKIKDYEIPLFNFNGKKTTMTYLAPPLQYCIENIFTSDKIDILKFMTDGVDEANDGKYEELLSRWCEIAKSKEVYGFYIVLTDEAKKGKVVLEEKNPCRFDVIDVAEMNGTTLTFNTLTPQKNFAFNIRDDYGKPIKIKFVQNGSGKIPEGYKIRITILENSYFEYDSEVTLSSDNSIEITPKYLKTKEQMIAEFSTEINEQLQIKISQGQNMNTGQFSLTRLLEESTIFEIINKPEKTVRFYVQ